MIWINAWTHEDKQSGTYHVNEGHMKFSINWGYLVNGKTFIQINDMLCRDDSYILMVTHMETHNLENFVDAIENRINNYILDISGGM